MSIPARSILFTLACALGACGSPNGGSTSGDLPVGDILDDHAADGDGNWGAALTCKPLPELPALTNPSITISLEGLTLHLSDPDSGYDKVFPLGTGAVETDSSQPAFGESKGYEPVLKARTNDFTMHPSDAQPCKTWWTDPDTMEKSPVFAGLPFMPFYGAYAIHGPIDNYRDPNGGSLRRGFVSHGCARMQAADVVEVYGRIHTLQQVKVHLQREPERDASGARVDVADKWVGAECASDGDCNYSGGVCVPNRYAQRSFCSARCTSTCSDKPGLPTTFCVADPSDSTQGLCVLRVTEQNQDCRPSDHTVPRMQPRFMQPDVTATVCMPGSRGWIGDHCFDSSDCTNGTSCAGASSDRPGICTESCSGTCPDQGGWSATLCAPSSSGSSCFRACSPASNASECPGASSCVASSSRSYCQPNP
jgi:hypothetical protein